MLVFLFVLFRQMSPPDWRVWFDRVGAVAAGGLGGALAEVGRRRGGGRAAVSRPPRASRKWFGPFALGFVILFPLIMLGLLGPVGSLKWINNYGVQIMIYVMLGWGLNIVVGLAGLLDLGYVAFYAVGAYSYALLSTTFGLSFWICLPLAGLLAAMWGVILGFPGAAAARRLSRDRDAGLRRNHPPRADQLGRLHQRLRRHLRHPARHASSASRSPTTTTASRRIFHLPYTPIYRTIFLFYLILALALLTNFVTLRLRRLPIGRAWEALREDEIACRSLGINTTNTKLTAFALGAMFGGFAGSFFSVRQGFVSPESFTFMESATILAIVVLGGMGSQLGVAIAAAVMIGAPELMRELDWMKRIFGQDFDPTQYRMLLFGAAMVFMMIWKPRGLVSTRSPSIFLKERESRVRRLRQGRARLMNWLTSPILTVENLTMRFGGLVAVNAFSFTVGRGDITALIGPNGAGKTTVFNCVTGFYKPTEGRLALARDGVVTAEADRSRHARQRPQRDDSERRALSARAHAGPRDRPAGRASPARSRTSGCSRA